MVMVIVNSVVGILIFLFDWFSLWWMFAFGVGYAGG